MILICGQGVPDHVSGTSKAPTAYRLAHHKVARSIASRSVAGRCAHQPPDTACV